MHEQEQIKIKAIARINQINKEIDSNNKNNSNEIQNNESIIYRKVSDNKKEINSTQIALSVVLLIVGYIILIFFTFAFYVNMHVTEPIFFSIIYTTIIFFILRRISKIEDVTHLSSIYIGLIIPIQYIFFSDNITIGTLGNTSGLIALGISLTKFVIGAWQQWFRGWGEIETSGDKKWWRY